MDGGVESVGGVEPGSDGVKVGLGVGAVVCDGDGVTGLGLGGCEPDEDGPGVGVLIFGAETDAEPEGCGAVAVPEPSPSGVPGSAGGVDVVGVAAWIGPSGVGTTNPGTSCAYKSSTPITSRT